MAYLYRSVLVMLASSALANCAGDRLPAACSDRADEGPVPPRFESPRPACPASEPPQAADPPEGPGVTVGIAGMMPFRIPADDRRMRTGISASECASTTPPAAIPRRAEPEKPAAAPALPAEEPPQVVTLPVAAAPVVAVAAAAEPPPRKPAVSDAPLQALAAYIQLSGTCAPGLVEWNRENIKKAMTGKTPRGLYYRVLGYLGWGRCGKPFFPSILEELQKVSDIHARSLVSDAEFEAKEAELVNLFFAAAKDGKHGKQRVRAYETTTAARLARLAAPGRYSDCTLFGDRPRCLARPRLGTASRRATVVPTAPPRLPVENAVPIARHPDGGNARDAVFQAEERPSRPAAVSDAPLQALNAYIELSGTCARELVEWNSKYGKRTMAGETPRTFYYRVLGYVDWGRCGHPFFGSIFGELQKISDIFARGLVSKFEFETKEAELINLFFAAVKDSKHAEQMVRAYETTTAARLIELAQPRQYFNCTFFGDQPRCTD